MAEILAKIGPERTVELAVDGWRKIEEVPPISPQDAAYLGRSMLACAATLSGPHPVKVGTLCTDAHLPVIKWAVGPSAFTGEPVLILTIPSGIELSFAIWPQGAKEIGAALVAQAQGSPLERQSGTVH
jgi:hypothetical protein